MLLSCYSWYNDITGGHRLPWGGITDCGITTRTDQQLRPLFSVTCVCIYCYWIYGVLFGLISTASSDPKGVSVHQVSVLWRCLDHEPVGDRNTYRKGRFNFKLCGYGKQMPFEQSSCPVVCPFPFQYGVSLYENYKTAEKKAVVSSTWTNRSTPSSSNPSTPSPTIKGSATHKLLAGVKQARCADYACTVCSHMMFLLLCQLNHRTRPMVTLPNSNQDLCPRYIN